MIIYEALLPKDLPKKKNYVKLVRIGYLWVFYNAYVHVSISLLKLELQGEGIFALLLHYPKYPQQYLAHYPTHSFVTQVSDFSKNSHLLHV